MSKALKAVSVSYYSPAFDRQALYQLSHREAGYNNLQKPGGRTFLTKRRRASSEALGSMTRMFEEQEASVAGADWAAQQMPRDHGRFWSQRSLLSHLSTPDPHRFGEHGCCCFRPGSLGRVIYSHR